MKVLILIACICGLATNAQAHDVEMMVFAHLVQHGWIFPALTALLVTLSPLLRRHR